MPEHLILRFDAPLLSFGGTAVDSRGVTQPFPSLSMLTGLLGNALGYDHRDTRALQLLQERIRFGARRDRRGRPLRDFQTVDITQPFLADPGWTTRDEAEKRGGGADTRANLHIRERDFWADAVFTVALRLEPPTGTPDLHDLACALRQPQRPLYLGRKSCPPAAPVLLELRDAPSIQAALAAAPRLPGSRGEAGALTAWFPAEEAPLHPQRDRAEDRHEFPVTDERDWDNQIVVGRRIVVQTAVNPPEVHHA